MQLIVTEPYVVGDIVRYTGAFLRSTGQYVGSPLNGEVTAVTEFGADKRPMLTVMWCTEEETNVLACNVEFCPQGKALTAYRRDPASARVSQ